MHPTRETTSLKKICDSQRGITYGIVKVGDYVPGGVPVIRGGDIREGRIVFDDRKRVTQEVSNRFQRTILKGGEILLNLIAEPGHAAIVPDDLIGSNVSRDVAVIPVKDCFDTRYICYFLRSSQCVRWLFSRLQGSVTQKINLNTLREVPVPLPPLAEQRAIARILGTLDDKIELNRQTNQTLEAMASAIFKSWFVDFDPVRALKEGRQPAYMDGATARLFPHEFEESVLGEIPKGWRVGKVDELAEIIRKGVHPNKYPDELFEHCSIPAFDEGQLPKSEQGSEIKSNKYAVVENSVLLSKLNPQTSRVWLLNPYNKNRVVCSTEFLVTVARNHISREYLYALFASQSFRDTFATLVTGTSGSHQRVKPQALLQMETLIPPQKVVVSFSKLARPIYEKKNHNIQESQTLANIRDTLLPKLMSGEIRVKEAEKQIQEIK